jgi:hypothetical protein
MHAYRYEFLQATETVAAATPDAIPAAVPSTRATGLAGRTDKDHARLVPLLPTSWLATDQVEQLTQLMDGEEET